MSIGLSTGLRALLTARRTMDVIGHNLANQNTPGYSRQIALLGTTDPLRKGAFQVGTGVSVLGIRGVVNEALLRSIRAELSTASRFAAEADVLDQVEAVLGDLSETGLAGRMQAFFAGATQAATKPEDSVLRENLVALAQDLALAFRSRSGDFGGFVDAVRVEAGALAAEANGLLQDVAALNGTIRTQEANGQLANDLRDRRSQALAELSALLGATATQIQDGSVTVAVSGRVLVTGTHAETLQVVAGSGGAPRLRTQGGTLEITAENGRLGGLTGMASEYLPDRLAALDTLARGLIEAVNKVHATGIPAGGPFTRLTSSVAIDVPAGVNPLAVTLAGAGLPFAVKDGTLEVSVTDFATGDVERHAIAIDADTTTVGDLVDALGAIPGLSASLTATGKLTISADAGRGFDFSRRLDLDPVEGGTFGAANAAVVAGASFPLALSNGATLSVGVDGGAAQVVTFNAADFQDLANATADEVAAVLNAQLAGATASVVDGRVVLASDTAGAASSLAIADGTGAPAAALGLPLAATGTDTPVSVSVTGTPSTFTGDLTFRALGDGQIGVTPGLQVEVLDGSGAVIATLDVGEGYEPGTALDVVDGVAIAFSPGAIAGSAGQQFELSIAGATDSANVLVALGMNALFTGTDAATIDVNAAIAADPSLLAGAQTGGSGDGANFLLLAALSEQSQASLGGSSLEGYYHQFAADVGATAAGVNSSLEASSLVLLTLETQRANQSGVNPDEELLMLEQFQQLYDASARYLSVLNELNDTLLNI